MPALTSGSSPAPIAGHQRHVASEQTVSDAQPSASKISWFKPRLLRKDELPAWYDANAFIIRGYRPISQSTWQCFASLLYMHNESLNIYTHLIPGVVTLSAAGYLAHLFQQQYPLAAFDDLLVFGFFIFTAVACMVLSALYHMMTSHSEPLDHLCLRADFCGIVLLNLGCFVSGIKMAFFCEPFPRKLYWTMVWSHIGAHVDDHEADILVLGSTSLIVLLSPFFAGPKWRGFRLGALVGTGLSGFAPMIHGLVAFGWNHMWQWSGMPYYFLEGGLFLAGAFFYATQIPESLIPGAFDIFGASHQIFHVLVVLATLAHSKGIFEAYDYNYHHRKCAAY